MAILLSFFLFIVVPIFFSIIYRKMIKESKYNLPPGPKKLPVIGNLHQLQGLFHICLHDLSKKHGPVMLLRLGFLPMVVITSSEAAEEALKTSDIKCCTRPVTIAAKVFSRDSKDIGFAVYSKEWRELRKLSVRGFFNAKKVRSFRYIREEETNLMVKKLRESALKQSPVDLSKTLFTVAASVVFRSAFGQSFCENKHIDKERIKELMFETQRNMSFKFSDIFPIAGFGWFMDVVSGEHKRLHSVFVEIDSLLNHIIDDHHSKNPTQDRPDLVDSILDLIGNQQQDASFKLIIDHLKGILSNKFVGGIDTTAITMIWAMAELLKNPRVMKKAQDEIRTCIRIKPNDTITEEDLNKLQYLKLVVKETLRLHPPAPLLLPRETMSEIKIQGYNIPKNTVLMVNVWSIGRDPKLWKHPEEFNPERFIDSPVNYKGQSFELLPFGSGRRICPGMASATATIELTLLNFLYFFNWKLPEEKKYMDMEEAGDVTIVKKVPLVVLPILSH